MPTQFDLIIEANHATWSADFRLNDANGNQLAYRSTDFKSLTVSEQQGLFYLRAYLDCYVDDDGWQEAVQAVGVCIADKVLGAEILMKLWAVGAGDTLRIQLPGAADGDNLLASALARVPWETARPAVGQPSLADKNLLLRVEHAPDAGVPPAKPLDLAPGESLRVLFVFAEAKGSHPLGARKERLQILRLFQQEIYPKRKVEAHFLMHGVTRARLKAQLADHGGYHIVHWSGHGNCGVLELGGKGGASEHITGPELAKLFNQAGVALPRLFFLSACNSGEAGSIQSMDDLLGVAQGRGPRKGGGKSAGGAAAGARQIDWAAQPGFTGTAHALLARGVPSVVAMRYSVGDDYARELAREFYRALLALTKMRGVAEALSLARRALQADDWKGGAQFDPCDHVNPVLYGADAPAFAVAQGKSPAASPRKPRLHQINEFGAEAIQHFVGRTWELAGLGAEFIGGGAGGGAEAEADADGAAVAQITGLGGMGKTSLCAEVLALWEGNFQWVLLYQAKPNALSFDATMSDIHLKLKTELKEYHQHVQDNPGDAVWRAAEGDFTGEARLRRMGQNLVRAMQAEAVLLVLDNFEGNLKPNPVPSSDPQVWECQDPAWDGLLEALATELRGSASRVLLTSRRPLAALARAQGVGVGGSGGGMAGDGAGAVCHTLALGPLAAAEAGLYLRQHPVLWRMAWGGKDGVDDGERELAQRLLHASRFHPLLMDRLARLAGKAELRAQLVQALETLEGCKDFSQLPALFAAKPGDVQELAYLDDALAASIDQLIGHASPDARLLLWMVAVANEPVALGLLDAVWQGEEAGERAILREWKDMLDKLSQLPKEAQADFLEQLQALPPEVRAKLDALPPKPAARPEAAPLLRHLVAVGLATEQRAGPEDANPDIACHELVRERIRAWIERQAAECGGLTENALRLAYADWLADYFEAMQHQNMEAALQAGSRALVYCVQADAYDKLGGFAGSIVTSDGDPRLLQALLRHLRSAAEAAPQGQPRWSCLCYLADALRNGGQPDASLSFYQQAAAQARAVAEAGGADARQAWADLGWINGNAANALRVVGQLDAARRHQLDSAEAQRQAGRPAIDIIGSELGALRIDIMQGQAEQAQPQVEQRLAQVAGWWQRQRGGLPNPEAPEPETLARTYISALDIATDADFARQDWDAALRRIDAILEAERSLQRPPADIAADRINRANVLGRLQRHAEARAEMEACLPLFRHDPARTASVLSSLAALASQQGDTAQALAQARRALALREDLPDPAERAGSHNNLANYLERSATPQGLEESRHHQLAALVYRLASGLGQDLQTSLHNYAVRFRHAHAANTPLAVPRLADLLAQPGFHPLAQWLRQRGIGPAELPALQAKVDEVLEQVRQHALAES